MPLSPLSSLLRPLPQAPRPQAPRRLPQLPQLTGALLLIAAITLGGNNNAARADERDCDEKDLTDSVRTNLHGQLDEQAAASSFFSSPEEEQRWLSEMSARLLRVLPRQSPVRDEKTRMNLLRTVHYEASRAGLDVQKVLAIIHVESAFRKYAISSAGARGYMQVMPFWVDAIGQDTHSLFALRTNLRYGTVIFRCYLDIEKGNYYRALGRYNGSLGRAKYPRAIFEKEAKYWRWPE